MVSSKKKVLMFLLNDFNMDNRVLKEATSLQKNNYQVFIAVTHFDKSLKRIQTYEPGIKVIRLDILDISFVKYAHFWIKCIRLFRNSTFDIIVCHDLNALPIGVYLKKYQKNKPKLIYDSHEFFPAMIAEFYGFVSYWLFVSLEKRMINQADYITTDSPSRTFHLKTFYHVSRPMTHLYNSYYNDILNIKALPLRKNPHVLKLVIMGNVIAKTRGFEMLPDFIKILKGLITDLPHKMQLLIVGDGYYRPVIQRKILETGHNDVVQFYGNLPYKKAIALIKNCDIGLILFNAFSLNPQHAGPNRIFDYMAGGLAVITTDLIEISRVVKREKIGWIVPQNYPNDLATLLSTILNNQIKLTDFKTNSKQSYVETYSWNKMEDKILNIYNLLLNSAR